ncbi:hypothetical protein ES703_51745 [subsurface metagenome]
MSGADYHPRTGGAYSPPALKCARTTTPAAVQNTYYMVVDLTNIIVYDVQMAITIADEDLEWRILVDGFTYTSIPFTATADTIYRLKFRTNVTTCTIIFDETIVDHQPGEFFQGKTVSCEVRKITNNGAGALTGKVIHGRY